MSQVVITIGRQFGSGGHLLAEMIADELGISLYDRKMENIDENSQEYDEKPVSYFPGAKVKDYNNSPEEIVAKKQFDLIRNLYIKGESFIIVGRCADYILKDTPNTLRVFVSADIDDRKKKISNIYNITEEDALELINSEDEERRTYHNYYSYTYWGEAENYDLCLNTTKLSLEKCKEIILNTINEIKERDC